MRLDKQALLFDNEQLLALDNSDIEQIKRKKVTFEKQRSRKNMLANAFTIAAAGTS